MHTNIDFVRDIVPSFGTHDIIDAIREGSRTELEAGKTNQGPSLLRRPCRERSEQVSVYRSSILLQESLRRKMFVCAFVFNLISLFVIYEGLCVLKVFHSARLLQDLLKFQYWQIA